MAAPIIKIHIVPDSYRPDSHTNADLHPEVDVRSVTGSAPIAQRTAKLIERAVCGDITVANREDFDMKSMIKLRPWSGDSSGRTYEIDIGPGRYHDTNKSNFWTENNWVRQNGSSWTFEKWVLNHREFAPAGGTSIIKNFQFQIFLDKISDFVGSSQGGGGSVSSKRMYFTYVPRYGAYSYNWNETGYPPGQVAFFGESRPVWQAYKPSSGATSFDQSFGEWEWTSDNTAQGIHYTFDETNIRITFSQAFYDNFVRKSALTSEVYDVYMRGFIERTNNDHSQSLGGVSRSNDNVYYCLPHDDLVHGSAGAITVTNPGGSNNNTAIGSVLYDMGLISFSRNSADLYPPSQATVTIESYSYHRWIRPTNDMTDDLLFRGYSKNGVIKNEIFNYENSNDAPDYNDGLGVGTESQQENPNFSWVDIKITNEATINPNNPSDLPDLLDTYIDVLPRGNVEGAQDAEQIVHGLGGLVNEFRPWDHQEGNSQETYQACFVRPVRDYNLLVKKPIQAWSNPSATNPNSAPAPYNEDISIYYNGGGSFGGYTSLENQVLYDNPMSQMNVRQAWRLKNWYKQSPQGTNGKRFMHNAHDNIMSPVQYNSSITLSSGDVLYARIVYILYDASGATPIKQPVASAPKSWTLKVTGDYIE